MTADFRRLNALFCHAARTDLLRINTGDWKSQQQHHQHHHLSLEQSWRNIPWANTSTIHWIRVKMLSSSSTRVAKSVANRMLNKQSVRFMGTTKSFVSKSSSCYRLCRVAKSYSMRSLSSGVSQYQLFIFSRWFVLMISWFLLLNLTMINGRLVILICQSVTIQLSFSNQHYTKRYKNQT